MLPHREALFGGSAGPGKSSALLMGGLQYVDVPGYAALILRKTYTDLSLPGALMDKAAEWLGGTAASWDEKTKTWHFPSGASLVFGYLDSAEDKYRYQSSEFQYIAFDELTQFPESDYRYMFSRLRRLRDCPIPIRMRSATNPGGPHGDWVRERFITQPDAPERKFVRALLSDNPHLDAEQYIASLSELDPITRQQLLEGDWDVREDGGLFRRDWFKIVPTVPPCVALCRFWDCASTPKTAGRDPDWTCGALVGRMEDGRFVLADMRRMRGTPLEVERLIMQTAVLDGKAVQVAMEEEGGSSGKAMIARYHQLLAGWAFRGVRSTGSKTTRASPVASAAESGKLLLVSGPWVRAFLDEAELFPRGAKDDQVDALSGSYSFVAAARSFLDPDRRLVLWPPTRDDKDRPLELGPKGRPEGESLLWHFTADASDAERRRILEQMDREDDERDRRSIGF